MDFSNIFRFEPHSHTMYSNLRLLDSINRPKNLIDRAIEIGLKGIAITDHECLSAHPEVNIYAQELLEKHPDFKVALGNEIYLCPNRDCGQKYYHFILIAKNKEGHKALRELSSRAWLNSFFDRGMERVVTTYADLQEIVNKYPNTLIATSACLGGEVSTAAAAYIKSQQIQDTETSQWALNDINGFVPFCKELFKEDFYIECAPGRSKEQIAVNKMLCEIAKSFNLKMVIGTDSHYLKKEDRFVHEAYLNSKNGEREVASFYEYSYLQDNEDIYNNYLDSFGDKTEEKIIELYNNSLEIYDKIENYSLLHNQIIPKVEVKDYAKPLSIDKDFNTDYPTLSYLLYSNDKIDRYWINECLNKLKDLDKYNKTYLDRLEYEADIKKTVGDKLGTNMFSYPVSLQHYINLIWDCGSIVGAGRGSSCSGLNHYLLDITQLDPITWNFPFWRYLNKERLELGDIDIDICPSKRPKILNKIKEERGKNFISSIDKVTRENCGCTLVATFGTEGTRSTILTACRGYRSKDCPDGIDVDTAQYMSSMIPSERGFLWNLHDVIYGNEEKNRKPISLFINEVSQYPGLLDIMLAIEGLVNKRSSHASGVILLDEDPYEFGCFMRTPSGDVITQYSLHMAEAVGMTKYDFLVTEVQDKLVECINLLQKDNVIENDLSLKEVYDKYFHPNVLPIEEDKYWKILHKNSVINVFQFDSEVGKQAIKKIKPRSILELSDSNGLMRLMTGEDGAENPMDKYVRFKNNINLWYEEMNRYGLTVDEMETLKPHFLKSHGVPPSQEQLMTMLMDENICGFTLKEANAARKIVGKKQMNKIPELKEKVLTQAKSKALGKYVWDCGIGPQMGYSFSVIHALVYSFIGFQTLYIATKYNPIYWNTACLIVNSGSLEQDEDSQDKEKSTDYAKIAKAIGDITSEGIKISLVDINKSDYSFKPDVDNNQILFGMKALGNVGLPIVEKIRAGRPYSSFKDFLARCPLNKSAMISLIKSGAFDNIELNLKDNRYHSRQLIMAYYLSLNCDAKKKLTLQNVNGLLQKDLIPVALDHEKRVFNFNKYLKAKQKVGQYYVLNEICYNFYSQFYDEDLLEIINGYTCILQKDWDKIYKTEMSTLRDWISENQTDLLNQLNTILFQEAWNKYALGTISSWEMDSMCFYYHEHELKNVDTYRYGIVDFYTLNETPAVERYWKRNGQQIPIFKTELIIGTVISKDDNHSSISLLTTSGVVTVKFTRDYYAMYKKQISEIQEDSSKKVMEKSWFTRGTKLLITGFRRDDTFVAKSYKNTPTHQLYKITEVKENGEIELVHERYEAKGEAFYE